VSIEKAIARKDMMTGSGKILIVDDSPDMRRTLSDTLRLEGFTAFTVESAEDALIYLENNEIAVVILDLKLPKMSGMSMLERLKSVSPDTEVIILTGYGSLPTAIEAIKRDVFAYIEKPADPEQVISTVGKAIEKRWLIMENARLTRELAASNRRLERRIAERTRSLAFEKARIEAIINSQSEAVVMFDRERRIASLNKAAERMFDLTGVDLVGKTLEEQKGNPSRGVTALRMTVGDRRKVKEPVSHDRRKPRPYDPLWRKEVIIEPKHTVLDVASVPVLGQEDLYIGRAFIAHDITKEKEINALKDEFMGLVSHELRSPLSTVAMTLDILESGKLGELREKQRKPVEIALRQCRMMADLIDKFLDISSIEADAARPKRQRVDIYRIITQAVQGIQPGARRKEIDILTNPGGNTDFVYADKEQLLRVCMILLDNAVKYTPPGGEVLVSTKVTGKQIRIDVADNGPGVPESEHAKVFEKFYRGSRTTSSSQRGSGLGLSLAKLIVTKHKGEIGVASRSGGGSIFWFSIPLTKVSG